MAAKQRPAVAKAMMAKLTTAIAIGAMASSAGKLVAAATLMADMEFKPAKNSAAISGPR